jgi:hypothetical protein
MPTPSPIFRPVLETEFGVCDVVFVFVGLLLLVFEGLLLPAAVVATTDFVSTVVEDEVAFELVEEELDGFPIVAGPSSKTAKEVLQHLVFSPADSQQYSAASLYPLLPPHSQT